MYILKAYKWSKKSIGTPYWVVPIGDLLAEMEVTSNGLDNYEVVWKLA
ncbi:MAG: hypothetical protein JXA25_08885 [Anaerolineales bacterium]|nr:hypothetical protein [Anaerolineales bacterium]